MQILIMRHGEAEGFTPSQARDADRQLTTLGLQQVERAGQRLQQEGFSPDEIWVSPYLRAQQTADGVTQSLMGLPVITQTFLTPDSVVDHALDAMECSELSTLMLISHQPLVSYLIARLSGRDSYTVPVLAPASMVLLQGESGVWGCFDILWQRHSPDFLNMF